MWNAVRVAGEWWHVDMMWAVGVLVEQVVEYPSVVQVLRDDHLELFKRGLPLPEPGC